MKTESNSAKILDFQGAHVATAIIADLIGHLAWTNASWRRKIIEAEFGRGAYRQVFAGIPNGWLNDQQLDVAERRLQRLVIKRLPTYPIAA